MLYGKKNVGVTYITEESHTDKIKENTKAVIFQHASNVTGNLRVLEEMGKICKNHNLLFILDAAQSAGLIPIDMDKANFSALCASG